MKLFANLKLQSRMVALLTPLLFLGLVGVGATISGINEIETRSEWVRFFDVQERSAVDAQIAARRMIIADLNYILTEQPAFITERARHTEVLDEWLDEATITFENLSTNAGDITLIYTPQELEDFGVIESAAQLDTNTDGFTLLNERLASIEGNLAAYKATWAAIEEQGGGTASEEVFTLIEQMDAIQNDFFALNTLFDLYAQDEKAFAEFTSSILIGSGVVIIITFIVMLLITWRTVNRQIAKPLSQLLSASRALRDGQYEAAMLAPLAQRSDEIGVAARAFMRMAEETLAVEAGIQTEVDQLREKLANLNQPS
jgi:HAMP domain-containing protein